MGRVSVHHASNRAKGTTLSLNLTMPPHIAIALQYATAPRCTLRRAYGTVSQKLISRQRYPRGKGGE